MMTNNDSEWTEEPWNVSVTGEVAKKTGEHTWEVISGKANAHRKVDCVNECAGLTTDEIKEAVRAFKYLKENPEVSKYTQEEINEVANSAEFRELTNINEKPKYGIAKTVQEAVDKATAKLKEENEQYKRWVKSEKGSAKHWHDKYLHALRLLEKAVTALEPR